MVDADRVRERLRRLDELLVVLEQVRTRERAAYRDDLGVQLKTQHALQLSLQVCIDVGAHLIAELGLRAPDDYRGVFTTLGAAGVVKPELADRLARAAGLRNRLVHGYDTVEEGQIFDALDRLDDLRAFAAAALAAADSAS